MPSRKTTKSYWKAKGREGGTEMQKGTQVAIDTLRGVNPVERSLKKEEGELGFE